jgi:hypothetical protein
MDIISRRNDMSRGWSNGKAFWMAGLSGAALVSIATMGNADEAHPKSRKSCAASFEKAQDLVRASHLRGARSALLACSRPVCGRVLARECTKELSQLEADIPSVVLSAKNDAGEQLVNVEVAMDGEPLTSQLDGRAVSVDPGVHQFFFKSADSAVDLVSVPIAQGERNRSVTVELRKAAAKVVTPHVDPVAAEAASAAKPAPAPGAEAAPVRRLSLSPEMARLPSSTSEPPKAAPKSMVGAYTVGTVGLAGLAGFGILYAIARNDNSGLSSCWPNCDQSRVDAVRKLYVAADVSLGVGVAALGVATWLYFDAKSTSDERPPPPRYSFDVKPSKSGLMTSFSGTF